MASSSLPISVPFPLRSRSITQAPHFRCSPLLISLRTSFVCLSTQNPSGYDREESLWLREEQRWIREEQRWLREEQRWVRDREALLQEISELQLRIHTLESRNSQQGTSVPDTISNVAALLQVLKEKNRVLESGSSVTPMVLENTTEPEEEEEEEEKEVVEKLVIAEEKARVFEPVKKRRTLKMGSEGEEVQAMQEALLKLGFYCGEEDMEFSSFSSGTSSAVMTWQSSLGLREDGIMTEELLQRLFMDKTTDGNVETDKDGASTKKQEIKEAGNGAVKTQVSEKQQSNIKDQSNRGTEVSQHRVFLLGENRWEDPSRLIKPIDRSKSTVTKTKCITCRGEGRLMCLECDGTGEPNIEPQFMEWVDEDTKCMYCEGFGFTVCDVCDGKTAA